MDTVFVRGLKVETIIGIFDWERESPQTLRIDLEMATNASIPAAHDDISLALDYKTVSDRISTYVRESRFQLIETLAENLAELVLREFPTPSVRLTVNKPGAIPAADTVGVTIERTRNAAA